MQIYVISAYIFIQLFLFYLLILSRWHFIKLFITSSKSGIPNIFLKHIPYYFSFYFTNNINNITYKCNFTLHDCLIKKNQLNNNVD